MKSQINTVNHIQKLKKIEISKTGQKKGKSDLNKKVKGKIKDNVKDACKRAVGGIFFGITKDNNWIDTTMNDWPDDDYRIFAGDLGNEVTDEHLASAFRKYGSFLRARVIFWFLEIQKSHA